MRKISRAALSAGRRSFAASTSTSTTTSASSDDADTHFGFRQVPVEEKHHMVREVFDSVASSYDVMNDVMSVGMHRLWKDDFVKRIGAEYMVSSAAAAALASASASTTKSTGGNAVRFLDVAGGTGDIAFRIAEAAARGQRAAGPSAPPPEIVISDINRRMLDVGERRASDQGIGRGASGPQLSWVEANAQELPFEDDSFDVYTIAFGIRNVTNIPLALSEARRVLKPGGRFLCLEFSAVRNPLFASFYDAYSMSVIPSMGQLVANDRDSYQYLVESIRRFPKQEQFEGMITDAGFQCTAHDDLTGGIVAIHTGFAV